jgi:hypothetical protein
MNFVRWITISVLVLLGTHVRAQNCLGSVYPIPTGATTCIQPGTSQSGPTQPVIYVTGGSSSDTLQGVVEVAWAEYAASAAAYYNHSQGTFETPAVPGGAIAYIKWNDNVYAFAYGYDTFEGGSAVVWPYVNGAASTSSSFNILGVNPSLAILKGALAPMEPPWWFGRTMSRESSNAQFAAFQVGAGGTNNPVNYVPLFGPPDGFGLTQIDGSNANYYAKVFDDTLWDWMSNLAEGVGIAESLQSPAYAYF